MKQWGIGQGIIKKVLVTLGVVIFLFIGLFGYTLATNYHGLGNLVKVISLVRSQYLLESNTDSMVEGAIKGVVESLDDPYSTYLDPQTFKKLNEQIHGSFGGLGILVGLEEQYLTVVRPYENTPAAKAGIKSGDKIVKINTEDVVGVDLDAAVNMMRGPVGSKINLTLLRNNEELKKTLVREEIKVPTVESKVIPKTEFGYISISQFTENTPNELEEQLKKLNIKQLKGIVLDLRNNPGGELIAATRVADQFVSDGVIVHIDYKVGEDRAFAASKQSLNLPLVVLINKYSASASEILAGAIKDHKIGTLVGTTSFGKGVVQTVYPLDNGAGLKLTTARYLTPNKHDINKKGIKPDVQVDQQEDSEIDLQLQKGIEILKTKA